MTAASPDCPRCGVRTRRWDRRAADLFSCAACGFVLRHPQPSDAELDALYRRLYSDRRLSAGTTDLESDLVSLENHARFLARELPHARSVLDFGAGTGYLARLLLDRGCQVHAVEVSANARRAANQQRGVSAWPSLEELIRDGRGGYDLIVAVEVVEHLTRPWADLRALHGLLRDGGVLYLSTPNRKGLLARLTRSRWREATKPFHLFLFDYGSLAGLLHEAGFVSVHAIRFSPLTTSHPLRRCLHRGLQLCGLYGGLRVLAEKAE